MEFGVIAFFVSIFGVMCLSPAHQRNANALPISIVLDERSDGAISLFRRHNVSKVLSEKSPFKVFLFLCARLRNRSFPFVGSVNERILTYLETFTRHYQVPYFTWNEIPFENSSGSSHPFIVSVRPDLTAALQAFIRRNGWRRFGYVYSTDFGFDRLQRIRRLQRDSMEWDVRSAAVNGLHLLHPDGVQEVTSDFDINNAQDRIYTRLKYLDRWLKAENVRNVVLDVNGKSDTMRLLQALQHLGMIRREYHYIIVDFGIRELPLSPFQISGVNISGFQLLDYSKSGHVRFMRLWARHTARLRLELHEIALLFDALSVARFLANRLPLGHPRPYTLVKCFDRATGPVVVMDYDEVKSWATAGQVRRLLSRLKFRGITGALQFDDNLRRKNYSVDFIQFRGHEGVTVRTGSWHDWRTADAARAANSSLSSKSANQSLASATLRVVSILAQPFLQYTASILESGSSPPLEGKENFTGFCKELADEIFVQLPNYDYDIHLVEDKEYGSLENRTWNGMVGEVLSGKADIIIAPLTITSQRARYLYFSEPFMTFGLSIMLKKPEKTLPGTFSFMYPLSNTLWISITASCVSVGVALYVIARLSPFEWDAPEDLRFNLFNSMWFSLSAFVQQGVSFSPASPGARLLSSLWWMFSIVIMAYYTANLAAFLTVERLITPIKSVKDLVEKRQTMGIEFGTLHNGSTKDFFANAKLFPYKSVYAAMQHNKNWYVKSLEEGVERVRKGNGKYAFIMESKMNEYIFHRDPCDTIMADEIFGSMDYGIAVPKNRAGMHELWDQLNHAVLHLREGQILDRMYREWWIDRGSCTNKLQSSRSLALINVSGVFYILFVGLVIAVLWAMAEASYVYRSYISEDPR